MHGLNHALFFVLPFVVFGLLFKIGIHFVDKASKMIIFLLVAIYSSNFISTYLIFAAFFVLAKFSVAAVPGGGILVMLPILESYLGFNAEMLSLIPALYILFDLVITCAHVLGKGGFAMGMDRLLSKFMPTNKAVEEIEVLRQRESLTSLGSVIIIIK